ncbi:MAG TPA: Gfo/Idh/MocA family oxidoreductase [Thermomicrobiales bacterium]|jgi:predicted dehydrogenase
MPELRFGVIGLRRGQSFVRICRVVGGATVTALYDVDATRVRTAAAELGVRAFTDYEQFLAAEIDAVIIASPLQFHARQAIAALAAGKHVLSEVTAADTLDDARALVAATRASKAVYMLSENYRYLDEVELLKRLHAAGRFGEIYFGEGEYLHDCRGLWFNDDGSLTWRGQGKLSVYCTHSLGPLLYITGYRVATVSALAVPGGKFDPRVNNPTMHLMQMTTTGGVVLRVRVDHVSPRPHQMAYYSLQGTAGSYEAWRGHGDTSKVWLADEHEPSLFTAPAQWHALAEQAEHVIPDRLAAPPEARIGGHGTSEYWLLRDFLAAARGEIAVPIDVFSGLDYTLPGLVAVESAAQGGTPLAVPDPREW